MWSLFAECGQIMRAADLLAHRVSGGFSVKMLRRSILTDSNNKGQRTSCPLLFGRSSGSRTHGLLDPNQARYHLRYTPIYELHHYMDLHPICQVNFRIVLQNDGFRHVSKDFHLQFYPIPI